GRTAADGEQPAHQPADIDPRRPLPGGDRQRVRGRLSRHHPRHEWQLRDRLFRGTRLRPGHRARVAAGIGVDSLPGTRGRPGTDTNPNTNADTDPNRHADPNPDSHADTSPDSHPGPNPDSHAAANAVAHSHTNAKPNDNSGAEPIDVNARRVRRPSPGWHGTA